MSGVYINMEMPKDRPQLLWVYPNGKALTVQSDVDPWKELQAVPVPPHGRLIDADAVAKMVLDSVNQEDAQGFMFTKIICQILKDAPIIIPADHIVDATEMVEA